MRLGGEALAEPGRSDGVAVARRWRSVAERSEAEAERGEAVAERGDVAKRLRSDGGAWRGGGEAIVKL